MAERSLPLYQIAHMAKEATRRRPQYVDDAEIRLHDLARQNQRSRM
jgi:hypothetical protein